MVAERGWDEGGSKESVWVGDDRTEKRESLVENGPGMDEKHPYLR